MAAFHHLDAAAFDEIGRCQFLDFLGPDDDIARFEYLKKSARNFGSVLIGIETSAPENFERLFARLDEEGLVYQDITEDETLAQFVI